MFLKINLGYLSQIALKNMQLLVLIIAQSTVVERCLNDFFQVEKKSILDKIQVHIPL